MRLIIHIGTHKTGSSALQQTFLLNRTAHTRRGLHYDPAFDDLDQVLTRIADTPDESKRAALLDAARTQVAAALEWAPDGLHVWSCEDLPGTVRLGYADAPERAGILRELLEPVRPEIVLYVRRQDLFLESLFTQSIQRGRDWDFETFCRERDIRAYDWLRIARAFGEAFGRDQVHVRPYERGQLVGGDTVRDFFSVIGVPWDDTWQTPGFANNGYTRPALELARWCNAVLSPAEKQMFRQLFQPVNARRKHEKFSFFSPEERSQLLEYFASTNRQLAREFLGRPDLFRAAPDLTPCQTVSAREVVHVLQHTVKWWQQRLDGPQGARVEPFFRRVVGVVQDRFRAHPGGYSRAA